ncbi:MAG: proton-conducting transporter membrane subunit, partial [Phycisphaeraceae bacterium]
MTDPLNNLVILLCAIPLAAGLLSIPFTRRPLVARTIGLVSFTTNFLLALSLLVLIQPGEDVLVNNLGGWPTAYAINLVFDSLSGLMVTVAGVVALGVYLHSFTSLTPDVERRYFHALMQMLMFGANLCFLTGDLFNLFVAFEIALMASYALICIGATRVQMHQAYKYVVLNLLASTVFVMAAGMTYGIFGTLNIADISRIVHEIQAAGDPMPTGFTALGVLLLFVFGAKGAFFPLWFWLPDTYYTSPIAVTALFSGLLTKIGVYCIMRTFPLVFAVGDGFADWTIWLLAVSAAFTMFYAVLGAVAQSGIRRILSIHIISQIGYMIFAIVVMSSYALAGCALFVVHNMVVKSSLFLCCGIIEQHRGTDHLDHLGGLLRKHTYVAVLFFIAAMSLVGLPPLSGFFGKLVIIHAGWEDWWWLAVFALLTSPLTLLSMLKIWSYGFWNPEVRAMPGHVAPTAAKLRPAYIGTSLLVAVALCLGLGAQPVFRVAQTAGRQLDDPTAYITAVLGPTRPDLIITPPPDAGVVDVAATDEHH